jgi:hypothetical protein
MESFQFGWPEARAVALAISIIGTWAILRYRQTPSASDRKTSE